MKDAPEQRSEASDGAFGSRRVGSDQPRDRFERIVEEVRLDAGPKGGERGVGGKSRCSEFLAAPGRKL